eukprot:04462.XXX_175393_175497_1 [CDS] Oithona nana genome sequencing.
MISFGLTGIMVGSQFCYQIRGILSSIDGQGLGND